MVCQRQGSEELAPELSAKRKRACPASILSARLLFAAVSVQGVAGLHSFRDVEARWWLHLYVMFGRDDLREEHAALKSSAAGASGERVGSQCA